MDKSTQAKKQRRGQPGNPGQFAASPSTQADAAPTHLVNLAGESPVAPSPQAFHPVVGNILPGGSIKRTVLNEMDNWVWDGPSDRTEENMGEAAAADIFDRLWDVPGYECVDNVDEGEWDENQTYWSIDNVNILTSDDPEGSEGHPSKLERLEVTVGLIKYDTSKDGLFIDRLVVAETDGTNWVWASEKEGESEEFIL